MNRYLALTYLALIILLLSNVWMCAGVQMVYLPTEPPLYAYIVLTGSIVVNLALILFNLRFERALRYPGHEFEWWRMSYGAVISLACIPIFLIPLSMGMSIFLVPIINLLTLTFALKWGIEAVARTRKLLQSAKEM